MYFWKNGGTSVRFSNCICLKYIHPFYRTLFNNQILYLLFQDTGQKGEESPSQGGGAQSKVKFEILT